MKKVVAVIISLIVVLGVAATAVVLNREEPVEFTPVENRVYSDEELSVEPATDKYVKMVALNTGNDIYTPAKKQSYVYRYGPTLIRNADGSIDAFFSSPGIFDEWDYIFYRHSPDGGKTWTTEKSVLAPTPDSADFYSCCDPGVVRFGGYYYLAYTSTVVEGGVDNNVFVARSKSLDGPYEKWNGNGWGGKPAPVIEYTGNPESYGAGEPSMVVQGDTLYFYYTWRDGELNQTRISIADAGNESWPATLQYKGVAIDHVQGDTDSADVKLVEDYGKFIAVSTASRFTTDSYIKVYVSNDGITFTESYFLKTNTIHNLHNCGITSRENGHIRLGDSVYLSYAYGEEFGTWATRIQEVELSLIDGPDFSDRDNDNVKESFKPVSKSRYTDAVGITTDPHVYEKKLADGSFKAEVYKYNANKDDKQVKKNITLTDFDENIISVDGDTITPRAVGETYVTAHWQNFSVTFLVKIK
ncbi:MAG: exo-alpha-sialidase [Clostridia bacterium]|nr:exo-alpha-sialidase [Clostridia bacterium]